MLSWLPLRLDRDLPALHHRHNRTQQVLSSLPLLPLLVDHDPPPSRDRRHRTQQVLLSVLLLVVVRGETVQWTVLWCMLGCK